METQKDTWAEIEEFREALSKKLAPRVAEIDPQIREIMTLDTDRQIAEAQAAGKKLYDRQQGVRYLVGGLVEGWDLGFFRGGHTVGCSVDGDITGTVYIYGDLPPTFSGLEQPIAELRYVAPDDTDD